MDQRPFHFRYFSMLHDQSTMKVGTDAVLLGAWTKPPIAGQILDVGTGSGILSLMLAQRTEGCYITAVDIDQKSVEQAAFNFSISRWSNRLKALRKDFNDIDIAHSEHYQLIISNPPFFTSTFKTRDDRKNLARHTDTLSHANLVALASHLLAEDGTLAVIIPMDSWPAFRAHCEANCLHVQRLCEIIPVDGRPANRVMIQAGKQPNEKPELQELILRETSGAFTPAYRQLLKAFYLGLD